MKKTLYPFTIAIKASNSLGFGAEIKKITWLLQKRRPITIQHSKRFRIFEPTRIARKGERVITYW